MIFGGSGHLIRDEMTFPFFFASRVRAAMERIKR